MGMWLKPRRSIVIGSLCVEDIEHRFRSAELDPASVVADSLPPQSDSFTIRCRLRDRHSVSKTFQSSATCLSAAILEVLLKVASKAVQLDLEIAAVTEPLTPKCESHLQFWKAQARISTIAKNVSTSSPVVYSEESVDPDVVVAALTASLRAMAAGNLLARDYRADNQLFLRDTAKELLRELHYVGDMEPAAIAHAESVVLAALNRVATAAVVTATNHPQSDRLLQLYDTASWLYDEQGKRRLHNTDSRLWLAWFPGFSCDQRTVRQVIDSMPSVPDVAIPAVIRLVENPKSWFALPGAMSLANHDILHVLLGRGLQDQDEAFVLGFAMGSTKKRLWARRKLFRWIVSRWYPEPYRIQTHLLPAFELGFQCGRQTGCPDLSKRDLTSLLDMTIAQARERLQIDSDCLRDAYLAERIAIPLTMATLRLDV